MKNWLLVLTLFACSVTQEVSRVASNTRHWDNPPVLTTELMRDAVEEVR